MIYTIFPIQMIYIIYAIYIIYTLYIISTFCTIFVKIGMKRKTQNSYLTGILMVAFD